MHRLPLTLLAIYLLLLTACGGGEADDQAAAPSVAENGIVLDVYKSETCGCCGVWTEYMQAKGYGIQIHHPADLNAVKDKFGIAPQWQSCHTAVSPDGYVFEGHIPEKYVKQFLDNPPVNGKGLAVPGMPLGSPGMEVGDRFTPYNITLLKNDGSTEVYASVDSAAAQF